MYEIKGLKEGIERAKINIKVFEDAINKELETISDYEGMIKVLEEKKDDYSSKPIS